MLLLQTDSAMTAPIYTGPWKRILDDTSKNADILLLLSTQMSQHVIAKKFTEITPQAIYKRASTWPDQTKKVRNERKYREILELPCVGGYSSFAELKNSWCPHQVKNDGGISISCAQSKCYTSLLDLRHSVGCSALSEISCVLRFCPGKNSNKLQTQSKIHRLATFPPNSNMPRRLRCAFNCLVRVATKLTTSSHVRNGRNSF